jgi:hypothetical protein
MANSQDLVKLQEALQVASTTLAKVAPETDEQGDDEGGTTGGSNGGGSVEVEKRLFAEVFGLVRNDEKKFGPVAEFDSAAYVAKAQQELAQGKGNQLNNDQGGRLKAHPILAKLAKFDGDTPNMNMNPQQNEQAQLRYQERLELRMGLRHRYTPQIKPSGM